MTDAARKKFLGEQDHGKPDRDQRLEVHHHRGHHRPASLDRGEQGERERDEPWRIRRITGCRVTSVAHGAILCR
jgi:hypothetical protein